MDPIATIAIINDDDLLSVERIDALYNLQDDPYEMDNLLFEGWPAAHAKVAAKLKAKLVAWLQEIGSPSVQGVNNRKLPEQATSAGL